MAPRAALQVDRLARDPLDRLHLGRLLRALRVRRHPVEQGVRLEPLQLHAADRRRCVPALRRLVGALREPLVQGAGAPGDGGGARSDRGAVRRDSRTLGAGGGIAQPRLVVDLASCSQVSRTWSIATGGGAPPLWSPPPPFAPSPRNPV